jgi:hypothetical protein
LVNDTQTEAQKNTLEQQKINLKQSITEAYFSAVFNKEKLRLSEIAMQRANAYLDAAKVKFEQGTILKNDLDKFTLDVSNAKLTQTKNDQDYELSLVTLQYQLNINYKAEPDEDLTSILNYSQIIDAQTNTDKRTELKAEEINLQLNELNLQKQKSRNLPTVSAYGNYSAFQISDTFNPFAGVPSTSPLVQSYDGSVVKELDASRENGYNQNMYPGFDPDNMYIGRVTDTDKVHDSTQTQNGGQLSDNPMDHNWGGILYTQGQVETGKYVENEVSRTNYATPKGAQNLPIYGPPQPYP